MVKIIILKEIKLHFIGRALESTLDKTISKTYIGVIVNYSRIVINLLK